MALPNFSRLNLKQECHELPTDVCMGPSAIEERALTLSLMMADGVDGLGNHNELPSKTRESVAKEVEALVTGIADKKTPSVEREQLIWVFKTASQKTLRTKERHKTLRTIICETKPNLVEVLCDILNEDIPGGNPSASEGIYELSASFAREDLYNLKHSAILLLQNLCGTYEGMTVWLWTLCEAEPSVMPVLANVIKNDLALGKVEMSEVAIQALHLMVCMTDTKYSFTSERRFQNDITLDRKAEYFIENNTDRRDPAAPMRACVASLGTVEGFVQMILNVTERAQFDTTRPSFLVNTKDPHNPWRLLTNMTKTWYTEFELSASDLYGPSWVGDRFDILEEFAKHNAIERAVTLLSRAQRNLVTVRAISFFLQQLMERAVKEVETFGESTLAKQMHVNMAKFLHEKDGRFRSYGPFATGDQDLFWQLMVLISKIQRSYKEYRILHDSADASVATQVPEGMLAYKIWTTPEWQGRMVAVLLHGKGYLFYDEVVRTLGNILFETGQTKYPEVWSPLDLNRGQGVRAGNRDGQDLRQGLYTWLVQESHLPERTCDSLIYYAESIFNDFQVCDDMIENMTIEWVTSVLDFYFEKANALPPPPEDTRLVYIKILKMAVLHGAVWAHFVNKIQIMMENGPEKTLFIQEMQDHLTEEVVLCKAATLGKYASPQAAVWMIVDAIKTHQMVMKKKKPKEVESSYLKAYQNEYMDCWNSISKIHAESDDVYWKNLIEEKMFILEALVYAPKDGNPMFEEVRKDFNERREQLHALGPNAMELGNRSFEEGLKRLSDFSPEITRKRRRESPAKLELFGNHPRTRSRSAAPSRNTKSLTSRPDVGE